MAALAIAGCGGGGSNANANQSAASTRQPTSPGGAATVNVRTTSLGKILVDSQGRTLYLFEKDTGSKSRCSGACASAWPPFRTSGKPKAGSGATASLVEATTRSDGKPEVTYNGHPLYYYAGDQKAGDTNGQGLDAFGRGWDVVSPAGSKIEGSGSGSASTSRGY